MSHLMIMSWRQRLLQVGTCVVPRNSCRRLQFLQQPVSDKKYCGSPKYDVPLYGYCAVRGGLPGSRSIMTWSSRGGPLLSGGLPRRARIVNRSGEFPNLLEDGRGGIGELETETVLPPPGKPVITVPVHLEGRLGRKMERESTKRVLKEQYLSLSRKGRKSEIVIHCKNQDLNHYRGQSYSKRAEQVKLASSGWRHKKAADDFFTLFPGFKRESAFFMADGEAVSFSDLGICEQLSENLNKYFGIEKPTNIQIIGIPQILKGKRTIVAAETGCGKTLVYLLPILNQVLEDKRFRLRSKPGHPTSVILLPSRELADQIYEVALQLTYNLDIKVKLLQGGTLANKVKNPPTTGVDILVATTNAIKVLSSTGSYGLSKVLHVVLDEADTLLDDSFFPELTGPFLSRFPWSDLQRDIQLTLVSATMPKGLNGTIGQLMKVENFYECTTPGLHSLLPHVPQTFLRLRKSQKPIKIKEMVKADLENNIPVIIFCNRSKTCDWLSQYLNDEGLDSVAVHGRMHIKYRKGRIEVFKRGEINVLISTDLASRGIDTVRAQHVINYEFPLYIADYIHRCGRTGRVGSEKTCRVTNFISRPGEVQAVQNIELSVRKDKSLPSVNANIKRLYGKHYGSFVEIQPIHDEENDNKKITGRGDIEQSDEDGESEEEEDSSVNNDDAHNLSNLK